MDIKKMPIKGKRNFTHMHGLMVTGEMKTALEELKLFHGVDVPNWLRGIIQRELDKLKKKGS
jgi:hypothetical protein